MNTSGNIEKTISVKSETVYKESQIFAVSTTQYAM